MKLHVDINPIETAARLKRYTYSPLCGLITSVGYSLHPMFGVKVRVNGGELSGMHVLLKRPAPNPGSYHIGGVGLNTFESEIKLYAEAVERYCAGTAILHSNLERCWDSRNNLIARTNDAVVDLNELGFGNSKPHKPFSSYNDQMPMTWVKVPKINSSSSEWIPAQLFYLGYNPRIQEGEPWIGTAVTSGTAVHTSRLDATIAAAYELIQVDTAMGTWHGASNPVRILLTGQRVDRLRNLLKRSCGKSHEFRFYWLPSPHLQDFTVACMMLSHGQEIPYVAVGLGADTKLETAMYKAFLECSGIRMLSVWTSFDMKSSSKMSTDELLDLDSNVSYYARERSSSSFLLTQFEKGISLSAEELPPDNTNTGSALARDLLGCITKVSDLYVEDFTTPEIKGTGLFCVRLWAPRLLTLSLPSAPMRHHPRYKDYGGFSNTHPHPYP